MEICVRTHNLIIFFYESDDKKNVKIEQQTENILEGVNVENVTCQDKELIPPDTGIIELLDDSGEETNIDDLNEGMTEKY